jgi:thioredoxin-dependent peroxiredoxin
MTAPKLAKPLPKSTLALPLALSDDRTVKLSDFAERWVILYFYPKDSTPGCTTEGLEFNALLSKFAKLDCDVFGVSRDSIKSHQNFCAKQGFEFPLVSDADEALCKAFDVIHEKNMYGKKVLGIVRSTFLIAPGGTLAAEWRGVKVPGHAQAVLDALKAARSQ